MSTVRHQVDMCPQRTAVSVEGKAKRGAWKLPALKAEQQSIKTGFEPKPEGPAARLRPGLMGGVADGQLRQTPQAASWKPLSAATAIMARSRAWLMVS